MKKAEPRLSIIIPVYNEGANIGATIAAIEAIIKTPHRIYIVYDFDEDDTLPEVGRLKDRGLDIALIRNEAGGVCRAIIKGLKEARGDMRLVSMADLSDDYSIVDEMCRLMDGGFDVVCGSRYMPGGRQIGGPFIKKTISRAVGMSLWFLAGLPTRDATNSFKLYSRRLLEEVEIESDGGFEIAMELAVKAHFSGYGVTELASTWRDREEGESRFQVLGWAPNYLRWYFLALKCRLFGGLKRE